MTTVDYYLLLLKFSTNFASKYEYLKEQLPFVLGKKVYLSCLFQSRPEKIELTVQISHRSSWKRKH